MSHTKQELLTSKFKKGESVHGPSHTGAPKDGFFAKPGEPGMLVHPNHPAHLAVGQTEQQHVRADLGKAPKPKRAFTLGGAPPIHAGMLVQTKSGGQAYGADHSSAVDALSGLRVPADSSGRGATVAHPLTKIAPPKNLKPVQPVPGMRSRSNDSLSSGDPGAAHNRAHADRAALHAARQDLGRRVIEAAIAEHPGKPFEWRAHRGRK